MSSSINALVFDVYGTLFDVYSVKEKCDELFDGKGEEISILWRQKQLEYSFNARSREPFEKTASFLGFISFNTVSTSG